MVLALVIVEEGLGLDEAVIAQFRQHLRLMEASLIAKTRVTQLMLGVVPIVKGVILFVDVGFACSLLYWRQFMHSFGYIGW